MVQTERKIVVLSDLMEEMDNLQHLLRREFGTLEKTLNYESALRFIHHNQGAVLIIAFQNIEMSADALKRIASEIGLAGHSGAQRLLLCKAIESEQAFGLYRSELIDDFVADRPLYDSSRLRLSVMQAVDRADNRRLSDGLAEMTDRITTEMRQLDRFVSQILKVGDDKSRKAADMFRHFTSKLVSELETLEAGIQEVDSSKSDKAIRKVVDQGMTNMRGTVKEEGANIDDYLNQTGQWLVNLSREREQASAQAQPAKKSADGIRMGIPRHPAT